MPRPQSLMSTSAFSAHDESQRALTPRTPHSRAGRAEEGHATLHSHPNDEDYELELDEHQQRAPLLASSASGSFPHRRDVGDFKTSSKQDAQAIWKELGNRVPLITGLGLAVFLGFLVILSVEKPESLHTYLHGSPLPPSSSSSNITDSSSDKMTMAMLSYENYTSFPLTPLEYRQECSKFLAGMTGPMGTYWYIPPGGPMDVAHPSASSEKTCTSSITYMLDGYIGLAADLALMAQAAGLARETNRTFFVDDRNWNRGRWTDHFQDVSSLQPGPEPGCLPPPPEELVACPRTARHWIINSRTALFHFGHHFMDEFENPYARELRRSKPIFQRAATSFAHTIRPNPTSAALIAAARRELGGSYFAVHVRRGDRKTEGWRWRGSYVPLGEYADAVRDLVERTGGSEAGEVKVWIASDDPAAREELKEILTNPFYSDAESTHREYSFYSLDKSKDVDLSSLASWEAYYQKEFNELEEGERVRLTRGTVVDFALVSGAWDWSGDEDGDEKEENGAQLEGVVCTISSNFCKLAAAGLGWERAFGFESGDPDTSLMTMDETRKRWVEIDTKGEVDPVWRAFEMF